MRLFVAVVLSLFILPPVYGLTSEVKNLAQDQAKIAEKEAPKCQINESSNLAFKGKVQIAKRGCCSWHKGVCGCKKGRVVCCDGSFSPSCTCATDDHREVELVQ